MLRTYRYIDSTWVSAVSLLMSQTVLTIWRSQTCMPLALIKVQHTYTKRGHVFAGVESPDCSRYDPVYLMSGIDIALLHCIVALTRPMHAMVDLTYPSLRCNNQVGLYSSGNQKHNTQLSIQDMACYTHHWGACTQSKIHNIIGYLQ